jgi:hypothetical protein
MKKVRNEISQRKTDDLFAEPWKKEKSIAEMAATN